ncbi:MAG: hypothetical protein ABI645_00620 [Pseudomonadota bacterium]
MITILVIDAMGFIGQLPRRVLGAQGFLVRHVVLQAEDCAYLSGDRVAVGTVSWYLADIGSHGG